MARAALRTDELLGVVFAQLLGRLLEEERGELHRLDIRTPVLPNLRSNLFELPQGPRREWQEPSFSPRWVGRSTTAGRHPESGLDVCQEEVGQGDGARVAMSAGELEFRLLPPPETQASD